MATQPKTKKRSLPAWMISAHNQTKQKRTSNDDGKQGTLNRNEFSNGTDGDKVLKTSECENSAKIKTPSEFISDSMPFVKVPGSITYTYETADCACICEEILSSLDRDSKVAVGFDMEWPAFSKESSKTALIQMHFQNDKCYLFQVCGMNPFPKQLSKLICDERILLVGLNIESDLWKLERDFDIRVKPLIDRGTVIDVGQLGKEKLKSSGRWDLNGLCKNVLGMKLNKDSEIRCGNWSDIPLSKDQIAYASADAYAGLTLYLKLKDL